MRRPSVNNSLMLMVAIPLVTAWLIFACYTIFKGLNDETGFIQDNLDFYVALIAIIGGPALLFINSILEVWKAEQVAEQAVMPERLALELRILEMEIKHKQLLEDREQQHVHCNGADESE